MCWIGLKYSRRSGISILTSYTSCIAIYQMGLQGKFLICRHIKVASMTFYLLAVIYILFKKNAITFHNQCLKKTLNDWRSYFISLDQVSIFIFSFSFCTLFFYSFFCFKFVGEKKYVLSANRKCRELLVLEKLFSFGGQRWSSMEWHGLWGWDSTSLTPTYLRLWHTCCLYGKIRPDKLCTNKYSTGCSHFCFTGDSVTKSCFVGGQSLQLGYPSLVNGQW